MANKKLTPSPGVRWLDAWSRKGRFTDLEPVLVAGPVSPAAAANGEEASTQLAQAERRGTIVPFLSLLQGQPSSRKVQSRLTTRRAGCRGATTLPANQLSGHGLGSCHLPVLGQFIGW